MSEVKTIATSPEPITIERLTQELQALGLRQGQIVLVHSSLSALGWVCGGAQTVIQALLHVLGTEGTLVMPAHSGDWSDPSLWAHPPVPEAWWDSIRNTMPAFDPDLTPTREMGVIPETFRKAPGAVRSRHPTSSFAALGPRAAEITAEQALEDAFGERSPLRQLYDLEGRVLLLGVGHCNNTMLHLAERRALGAKQVKCETGSPVAIGGVRRWVTFWQPVPVAEDFEALGAAFENEGAVHRSPVGQADARLMGVKALVNFAVPWFQQHRTGQ